MTDRVTAYHEAGHAVAATVFGFDARRVQVHQPGTRGDEAGRCDIASWRQDLDADPVRALCYLLCGAAAERRLTGRTSPRDARDRAQAATVAAAICDLDDEQHPRVRAMLDSAEALARALMYDAIVWRAIERCAAALQRTGVLTGRDVQLIVREARQR